MEWALSQAPGQKLRALVLGPKASGINCLLRFVVQVHFPRLQNLSPRHPRNLIKIDEFQWKSRESNLNRRQVLPYIYIYSPFSLYLSLSLSFPLSLSLPLSLSISLSLYTYPYRWDFNSYSRSRAESPGSWPIVLWHK